MSSFPTSHGFSYAASPEPRSSSVDEVENYTAICNYRPKYSDELQLEVGDKVQVLSREFYHSGNLGWWTGKDCNGKIGIFPATLVRPDSPAQSAYVDAPASSQSYEVPFSEITLHEVVGVGGFGMVHRASWNGKEVAAKIAKHATLSESTKILEEAKKFALLSHPNICALLCTCTSPPTMIIQYAAGGNLSDALHKQKTSLSTSVIIEWASQIARGMEYLHSGLRQSLIHRDLKSCNILIEHKLDSCELAANNLLISDFGLAHEIQHTTHTTHVTGAGTYAYMAPEALMSTVSKYSDVWSYGVVLWELLTGEIPYHGLEGVAIAFGVGTFTLTLPIPKDCPALLSKLLADCWHRDPHQRPSFSNILEQMSLVTPEFLSTPPETFESIRMNWKEEVQRKFLDFKDRELDLQLRQKMLIEKEKELLRKEQEVNEKLARVTSMEEAQNNAAVATKITPRQQPSPMINFMKRLASSFKRKKDSKSKISPRRSPQGSLKKKRCSDGSQSASSVVCARQTPHRDRSHSDILRSSIERLDCQLPSTFADEDALQERLRAEQAKANKKKKNSLDIPLTTLVKSNSFGNIITPTYRRPGDLSLKKSGANFLSPTMPPSQSNKLLLNASSISLERDSGKESAGSDTPHSSLMQFDSPVKAPARPLSVDDLFKLCDTNTMPTLNSDAASPVSTTSFDSAYIPGRNMTTNSSGNASPCVLASSPKCAIPRPRAPLKIHRSDLIPCPPGFFTHRRSSVESTPCSSRSTSPGYSRKTSESSPISIHSDIDHPLNIPIPPCLDQPLINSTPIINNSEDFKFLFERFNSLCTDTKNGQQQAH